MLIGIYAVGKNGEFGNHGDLPWKRLLPTDLKWFKHVTTQYKDAVLACGSVTADTLPPLPGRTILTLSRDRGLLIDDILKDSLTKDIIVIGGAEIFTEIHHQCDIIYRTVVDSEFEADTHLRVEPQHWMLANGWQSTDVPNLDKSGHDVSFQAFVSNHKLEPLRFDKFYNALYDDAVETKTNYAVNFTDAEMAKIEVAAEKLGMTNEEYLEHALTKSLKDFELTTAL